MSEILVTSTFDLAPGGIQKAVCTFHFLGAGLFSDDAVTAEQAVDSFWRANAPGLAASIGAQMSPTVLRPMINRAYNLLAAPPRVPIMTARVLPNPVQAGSSHVPADVAACLSYQGAPPNTRRTRGRIFIPGVWDLWLTNGSSTTAVQFLTGAGTPIDVVTKAAGGLVDYPGITWVVRSEATVPAISTPITNGWMDVEPDTQRRRGTEGAGRVLWS